MEFEIFSQGIRPDNEWLQYRCGPDTSPADLSALWSEPFSVKPWMGFYSYVDPLVLRTNNTEGDERADESSPEAMNRAVFAEFFSDKEYVEK